MSWRDALRGEFEAALPQFLADHPHYTIDPDQPEYRGGTNYITFAHHGPRPAILKYFISPARWNNELYCLRHFASTSTVPRVLDAAGDRWIAMERLAGQDAGTAVMQMRQAGEDVGELSTQIGSAIAKLVGVPAPLCGEGYCTPRDFACVSWGPTAEVLSRVVEKCRRIVRTVPAYTDPVFRDSLHLLESQLDRIRHQRPVLFHEDIWNLKIADGRFAGFFDLEMCRLGTEPMQLAAAMTLCGPQNFNWPELQAGFEQGIGRTLSSEYLHSAYAMGQLYAWTRICHWGSWDGDPARPHQLQSSVADAGCWRSEIIERFRYFRTLLDLDGWFPSLR